MILEKGPQPGVNPTVKNFFPHWHKAPGSEWITVAPPHVGPTDLGIYLCYNLQEQNQ